MALTNRSQTSWSAVHSDFLNALPRINGVIRSAFRYWPSHRRDEAIADAQAATWYAWAGLVKRGKDPLAVGPAGIAANAVRYVRNGRQLGTGSCGRGVMDVYNPRAQRCRGFILVSLDRDPATERDAQPATWHEWVAVDNRVSPADEACFRLDFAAWLAGLPPRKRQMAELLVQGHETGVVARLLAVTPGAISQTRGWLQANWQAFQARNANDD